jgi:hypothetical protein
VTAGRVVRRGGPRLSVQPPADPVRQRSAPSWSNPPPSPPAAS